MCLKVRQGEKHSRQNRHEVMRQREVTTRAEARESETVEGTAELRKQIDLLEAEVELRDDRLAEREQRVSDFYVCYNVCYPCMYTTTDRTARTTACSTHTV